MFLKLKKFWFLTGLMYFTQILYSLPQPITDLQVVETKFRQIKIKWTSPLSEQPILYYQIRVSTYRVLTTEDDWNNNSTETSYPYIVEIETYSLQGQTISYTFTNLENFKTYFFAIKSSTSSNKVPLSSIDNNPFRPYAQPVNHAPYWLEIAPVWPAYGVLVTSNNFVGFDFKDAYDEDLNYGDSLKYELYYSTKASALFGSTPPLLTGAYIGSVFGVTTSYVQILANNFSDNTTYYWRVKVIDYEEKFSWSIDNSDICRFIINHTPEVPSTFTLILPYYGKKIQEVTDGVFFDWTEPADNDPFDRFTYSLYMSSQSQNSGFSLVAGDIDWSSYTLSSIFGSNWVENQKYFWFVKAKDSYSLTSYSLTYYFVINSYEEPPYNNSLITPGTTVYFPFDVYNPAHVLFTLKPTFYWTASSDIDLETTIYYQLFISSFSSNPDELNSLFYTISPIFTTYYYLSLDVLKNNTTYYWQVRIWDEPYSGYAVYSSSPFWFFTCTTNTPPKAAILKKPPDNFTTSYFYPKFEWDTGKDEGFNASISSQAFILWNNFETIYLAGLSKNTSFYIHSVALRNNTTYFWQVITYDNGYPPPQLSSGSAIFSFYIKNSSPLAFNLISPLKAQIVQTQNIQIFWEEALEPDSEPVTYKVIYSSDNFLSLTSSDGIKTTNFIIPNLKDNTTYWWYVCAYDVWGFRSFSSTFYFIVDNISQNPLGFNLVSPQNNFLSLYPSVTFYWQSTSDPDPFESVSYEVIISTELSLTPVYFSTKTENTYFYADEKILNINTTYYWTVVAISSRSGQSFASNGPFKFSVYNTAPTRPILIFPLDKQIITKSSCTLSWSRCVDLQNDEFYYELYISTNNINFEKFYLSSVQNEFQVNLIDDTTYWWYVVVVDTFNNKNHSDTSVFYTSYYNIAPAKPKILQPVDAQLVNLPYIIRWSSCSDSDIFDRVNYRIEISTDENFFYKVIVNSQPHTSYLLEEFKLSFGTYYLRVIAYDTSIYESYSDTISFIIPLYNVQLFSPQNLQTITALPIIFSYSKVEPIVLHDTITYKIVYSSSNKFDFKNEIKTFSTFYLVCLPPILPATYFWYIEVSDSHLNMSKSQIYSFIIPYILPPPLLDVSVSTSSEGLLLSWESLNFENFWCYRIYKGYETENMQLIGSTTEHFFLDRYGLQGEFYYTIKTVNQFGIESENNKYIKLLNGKQVDFYFSQDRIVTVLIPKTEGLSWVDIQKLIQYENEVCPYVYEILSSKNKTDDFFQIQFIKPQGIENYSIQYYDGNLWQDMFSYEVQEKITVNTQYLGRYRLVLLQAPDNKRITIIGCSPTKKIITPNNDGYNDYIEFHYEVGSYIIGYLYDVNLKKICKLKNKDKNILYFDGKNEDGNFIPPGIYIYYITSQLDNRSFTGTVVIKY
ncbi:MAG: hypothetical protein ABDH23_03240 [Endomicrobiia bacterium]